MPPRLGVLKGRDPARPDGTAWVEFAVQGPEGPIGPDGPPGITGPPGNVGVHPGTAEVWVNTDMPNPALNPEVELWYDLDDTRVLGPSEIPLGGAQGAPMTMRSDMHGDIMWGALPLPTTNPGTVNALTTRNLTVDTLAAPSWEGDTNFAGNISAESVNDAGYEQHLAWEELDVSTLLVGDWHSDLTIGPCKAWRNRYMTLLDLCLASNPSGPHEVWIDVCTLPVGWRPMNDLWDARISVDPNSDAINIEVLLSASGLLQIKAKALNSPDWNDVTRMSVYFCYPRSG